MTKTQTIPHLRFAGFTGEWQDKKLGEVAEFSKGSGYSKGDLVASGTPVILYGRLYTNYETTIKKVDTFVIEKDNSVFSSGGEVIIPASGETSKDIARASAVEHAGILLGGDLNILKPKEDIDSSFLAISISNGSAQKALAKKAQGKSVVHVRNADIAQLSIPFPENREQEAIGDFFAKLDRLISLQGDKLATLKEQKKTYLSQLFPKLGAKQPQLRFAGFTDDWQEKKLGEVVESISSRQYLSEVEVTGKYPVIQQGDNPILGYSDVSPFHDFQNVVLFGDHTLSLYKPDKPFLLATDGIKILTMPEVPSTFLFCLLTIYLPLSQGYKRHFTLLKEQAIAFPTEPEEQEAIGNFFAKFDRQLELEEAKLAQLKESKKTFLKALLV